MIDESHEFGARVARPVGFVWDGGALVSVYSQPGARIRNIVRNPKVTLNFGGDGVGGDIVILSGTAVMDESGPSAVQDPAYAAKYATEFERFGMTAETYARRFSVPVRIRIATVNGR
ncbi:MAG: pyridoxamine 5'-phosphate oxidase family protein [Candidatus Dormibacteraceae bacterium]